MRTTSGHFNIFSKYGSFEEAATGYGYLSSESYFGYLAHLPFQLLTKTDSASIMVSIDTVS